MTRELIFLRLWENYIKQNPTVIDVYNSFTKLGEKVSNDHVAFRTFNDPRMDISVLERPFIESGYVKKGEYIFEEKKLMAAHYEVSDSEYSPKIFISQLLIEKFSQTVKDIITKRIDSIDNNDYENPNLIFSGNIWGLPSYNQYNILREESEYAAWLYVFGFRANHFTVNINSLKTLTSIEKVNQHLKDDGFTLNTSGGEIKGTKKDLLQQSSIMAENIDVKFIEGTFKIPGCYYEFAIRYPDSNGDLFNGFLAKNANRIFESTDFHK